MLCTKYLHIKMLPISEFQWIGSQSDEMNYLYQEKSITLKS